MIHKVLAARWLFLGGDIWPSRSRWTRSNASRCLQHLAEHHQGGRHGALFYPQVWETSICQLLCLMCTWSFSPEGTYLVIFKLTLKPAANAVPCCSCWAIQKVLIGSVFHFQLQWFSPPSRAQLSSHPSGDGQWHRPLQGLLATASVWHAN